MATRSTIWVKNKDGIYNGVYCHNDGYLENNGAILLMHYMDVEKVKTMISHGSLSSLAYEVGESCNFDRDKRLLKEADNCCFYHRDRGEPLKIYKIVTLEEMKECFEEYNYLYEGGKWLVNFRDEWEVLTENLIMKHWGGNGFIYERFAIKKLRKAIQWVYL